MEPCFSARRMMCAITSNPFLWPRHRVPAVLPLAAEGRTEFRPNVVLYPTSAVYRFSLNDISTLARARVLGGHLNSAITFFRVRLERTSGCGCCR